MKVPFVDEVEQFNNVMGKPNNYTPLIPEEKEWKFVYDFILEELNEYKEACENKDIVGVADALGDIMYVLCNGIMLHGMKDKITQVYQEIQLSNMSKVCKTEKEAIETALHRSKELGVEPIEICSSLFSAQQRKRLYWTNINVDLSKLPKSNNVIADVLDLPIKNKREKS